MADPVAAMKSRYPQYDGEPEEDQGIDGRWRSRCSEAYDDIMKFLNDDYPPSSRAKGTTLLNYFDNPNRNSWLSLECRDSASLYSELVNSQKEREEEPLDSSGSFEDCKIVFYP